MSAVHRVVPAHSASSRDESARLRARRSAGSGATISPRSIARSSAAAELVAVPTARVHLRLVDGERAACRPCLRAVHRDVGVAQQLVGRAGLAAVERRCRRWRGPALSRAVDVERRLERLGEPLGDRAPPPPVAHVLERGPRTRRRRAGRRCRPRGRERRSRSATAASSWSPAWCPRLSLMSLKSSRSRKSTAGRRSGPAGERLLDPLDEERAVRAAR